MCWNFSLKCENIKKKILAAYYIKINNSFTKIKALKKLRHDAAFLN